MFGWNVEKNECNKCPPLCSLLSVCLTMIQCFYLSPSQTGTFLGRMFLHAHLLWTTIPMTWVSLTEIDLMISRDLYREHGEHALADIEGMSPVVVQNHPVVFPDSQQPSTQCLEGGDTHRKTRPYGAAVIMRMHGDTFGDTYFKERVSPRSRF